MTLNFCSVHADLHLLYIALIHYDHDDTAQAASTVMDILISKKEVIGVLWFISFLLFSILRAHSASRSVKISRNPKVHHPPFHCSSLLGFFH
jgi:hypothetical protein